jgi:hypothetical protein
LASAFSYCLYKCSVLDTKYNIQPRRQSQLNYISTVIVLKITELGLDFDSDQHVHYFAAKLFTLQRARNNFSFRFSDMPLLSFIVGTSLLLEARFSYENLALEA